LIIDASVAFKWLVNEQDSHVAISWLGRDELAAPTLLHAEVANALWKAVRRTEIPGDDETGAMLLALADLIVPLDERPIMPRALAIGLELDHAVYDCIYLALAEARGEKLLTADAKFARKLAGSRYRTLLQPFEPAA
jgi:predicted nucleic acid-binding protein